MSRAANPRKFDRCVKAVKKKGGAKNAYAVCAKTRNPRVRIAIKGVRYDKEQNRTYVDAETPEFRKEYYVSGYVAKAKALGMVRHRVERELKEFQRNPASAASAGYEEFHGHPSSEVVTVTKQVHFHEHLSGAGQLRKLIVKGIDGKTHSITGFKGAVLAFNEKKSQLFIEGGDQAMNVEEFGIRKPHELETLGQVKAIEYQTDKSHLGDEGGHAVYAHRFRTTNQNGEHVTVKIARYPDLIYRVLDQQLEFSGGSYEIRAEGIDK